MSEGRKEPGAKPIPFPFRALARVCTSDCWRLPARRKEEGAQALRGIRGAHISPSRRRLSPSTAPPSGQCLSRAETGTEADTNPYLCTHLHGRGSLWGTRDANPRQKGIGNVGTPHRFLDTWASVGTGYRLPRSCHASARYAHTHTHTPPAHARTS